MQPSVNIIHPAREFEDAQAYLPNKALSAKQDYTGADCCSAASLVSCDELHTSATLCSPAAECSDAACANCGGELPASHLYSPDGLAFCTSECERAYPKTLQSPEFRGRLRGTAVFIVTSVSLVLLGIIRWCR